MKEAIRLSIAIEVISTFNLTEPLSSHLKRYFSKHKQMGSGDRRICRELVYNYYRFCKSLPQIQLEIRIACGNFLFSQTNNAMVDYLISTYLKVDVSKISLAPDEKIAIIKDIFPGWEIQDIFPFTEHLSPTINRKDWLDSFFIKPLVWVRAAKMKIDQSKQEFDQLKLNYITSPFSQGAFGFEAASKINETKAFLNGIIEIQDISSQLTSDYFKPEAENEKWWDCCAGSGGKSLLLLDQYPSIELTVSDNRESVLSNLKERLKKAGHRYIKLFVADLSKTFRGHDKYDAIILDAPCSGSGTWNRTPEMLSSFDDMRISMYSEGQKLILKNVIPSLKDGGKIIYITCSVFKEENEEVVEFVSEQNKLKVESMHCIQGYYNRADTMFVAVLRKN